MRDLSLLTNFDPADGETEIFLQAATTTGFHIWVTNYAYDMLGNRYEGAYALHTGEERRDHGPFWAEVERLVAEAKANKSEGA